MKITGLRTALGMDEDGVTTTEDLPVSAHVALALARTTMPGQVYAGTADPGKVAKRRGKNKRAAASRRINRGRR